MNMKRIKLRNGLRKQALKIVLVVVVVGSSFVVSFKYFYEKIDFSHRNDIILSGFLIKKREDVEIERHNISE